MPYKNLLVLVGCMVTLVLAGCDPFSSPKGKYDDTLRPDQT